MDAHIINNVSNTENIDVDVSTANQSKVTYNPSSDISLVLAEPGDSESATASISLTSSNAINDQAKYSINLNIEKNTFEYDPVNINDSQLIAILSYSFDGENYTSIDDEIDLTGKTGTINLINNQTLSSAASETKVVYWNIKIEYPSYDYNQINNMQKEFKGIVEVAGLE